MLAEIQQKDGNARPLILMPRISFVLARSFPAGVIGNDNKLPWRLKSDLRRFQKITSDHVIVMGRKTFESIGRPLPKRINIILSRELTSDSLVSFDSSNSSGLYFAKDQESALYLADLFTIAKRKLDIFVVGGAEVYKTLIDLDIVHRVYLTEVYCDVLGDAFYREKFDNKRWKTIEELDKTADDEDEFGYRYTVFERRRRKNRYRFRDAFFTDQKIKSEWLLSYISRHKNDIRQYEFNFAVDNPEQISFDF